jgi:nickel/cobalt exporter
MLTRLIRGLGSVVLVLGAMQPAFAHPLGNFTINHFAGISVGAETVDVHYVVDMAEIPAFQELQTVGGDDANVPSAAALAAKAERMAAEYAAGLALSVDAAPVPLRPAASRVTTPPGSGGLVTLRLEMDVTGALPPSSGPMPRRLRFADGNHAGRVGWNEIVARAAPGVSVFDSSAFGSSASDELRHYPDRLTVAPLDERAATLSFTIAPPPSGAQPLLTREGASASPARDRLAELVAVPELTPAAALLGVLCAMLLGGLHALSPGHGKTVVGAYLVGSRGTARHAAFLGLTVTITHTLGVFALGLLTLFASQYVLPERLFPILSLTSGAIVVAVGLGLLVTRLRSVLQTAPDHVHDHHHEHEHREQRHRYHDHHDAAQPHSHGGRVHSHQPPGADGAPVTWRSLLALGISGGIVPCPSALVVLLAAVALGRIAYGLLLIVGFSAGLAGVLTAVGLLFVYARRVLKRPISGGLARLLPVCSAVVITVAGLVICWQALPAAGLAAFAWPSAAPSSSGPLTVISVLGIGLVFGLKHALEADHVAAVSIVVSERRSLWSASLVGALWGIGHTLALLAAGGAVILLHLEISDRTALGLELVVALMLIALGANALRTLWRGGHLHAHAHRNGRRHVHPHAHQGGDDPHTHHRIGLRPVLIGMVHGLAGSAALMLLVLSTLPSPLLGFAYIAVFGAGSIGGMLAVSVLMSLPLQFTARRVAGVYTTVRTLAALFSFSFGVAMAYGIVVVDRLLV